MIHTRGIFFESNPVWFSTWALLLMQPSGEESNRKNPETVGAGPIMNHGVIFRNMSWRLQAKHICPSLSATWASLLSSPLGKEISITRLPSQNISISWLLNPTFDGKNPTFDPSRLWIRSSTTPEEGHAGINEEAKHPIRLLYCTYFDGTSCVISNPESVVC